MDGKNSSLKCTIAATPPKKTQESLPPHFSSKVHQMEYFWKTELPRTYPEMFIRPLTMKERGMLKMFAQAIYPHAADNIFKKIITSWSSYCSYVEDMVGASVIPSYPSIPFLRKYSQEAVNFVNRNATITNPKPPSIYCPPKVQKKEIEIPKPMTLEELLEIEKQLEA